MQSGVPLGVALPILVKAIVEVPDLCKSVARGIYKKHISSVLDYYLKEDGTSTSLWVMSFRITNLCNHRCAVCAQWGDSGYNFARPNSEIVETVPLETYKRVIDETAHLSPHIYITGGEPSLYRHLVPFVNHIKKHNLSVQIVTNGVMLERDGEEIVDNQWDVLCVSIDGTREIHDECRGVAGAYDTLLRGVGHIQELKAKRGVHKPYIIPITTISETNAHVLVESLEAARALQPDGMVVYYSWFTTQEIGERHVEVMERSLGCTPTAWKGYVRENGSIDTAVLMEGVRRVRATDYGYPILFVPNLALEEIPAYYENPQEMFGYKRCVAPWFMVDIMPNGDVVTCRDHPDYLVGNIRNDSLLTIYNNERYKAFRNALRDSKDGLFPICARCCGLMGY